MMYIIYIIDCYDKSLKARTDPFTRITSTILSNKGNQTAKSKADNVGVCAIRKLAQKNQRQTINHYNQQTFNSEQKQRHSFLHCSSTLKKRVLYDKKRHLIMFIGG